MTFDPQAFVAIFSFTAAGVCMLTGIHHGVEDHPRRAFAWGATACILWGLVGGLVK